MRRLYIAPKSVWFAAAAAGLFHPTVGAHFLDLVAPGVQPATYEQIAALVKSGGHSLATHEDALRAFAAANGGGTNPILLSTAFWAEGPEDLWHGHPAVAILPHPAFEGTDAIAKHLGSATKRIAAGHLAALKAHPLLGFKDGDTVLDLARKASALHPQVKLRHIL